jgi:predicted transcriptional regulator
MITETESLTVRIKNPIKEELNKLAKITERSMSYHTEKALKEYIYHEKERVEQLSQEVHLGINSLDAGKGIRMTSKIFDDVKKRGRERLAKLQKEI